MSKAELQRAVIVSILGHMHACRRQGVSFADCLSDARILYNREVNGEALTQPMPSK